MKQFIVLTAITGEHIAVRPSDITSIEESNGSRPKIIVKTADVNWNISTDHHSIYSILEDIEKVNN